MATRTGPDTPVLALTGPGVRPGKGEEEEEEEGLQEFSNFVFLAGPHPCLLTLRVEEWE